MKIKSFLQRFTILKQSIAGVYLPVVVLLTGCSLNLAAQGDLMITPRRVIFEGQKKIQELNLANTGKDSAKYIISMLEVRMKEDGGFELITQPDSGQNFASNFVRFFPRNVILGPGEAQIVKIQITKQSQLLAGEYRSHIYFRSVPNEKPLGEKEVPKDSSGISVQLTPIFGISIPVIIKVGESTSTIDISNTAFKMQNNTVPTLNMVFNRSGNMSTYGNIKIDFVSPQGKIIKVAEINGVAVYTPTLSRSMSIPLNKNLGIDYKTGKLHVVYMTSDPKSVKIAETELPYILIRVAETIRLIEHYRSENNFAGTYLNPTLANNIANQYLTCKI